MDAQSGGLAARGPAQSVKLAAETGTVIIRDRSVGIKA